MAIGKIFFCNDEFSFRFEDHEIGVVVFGNAAFAWVATGETRRALRHPARDIRECESAGAGFGPHHRQRQREACDSSPCRSKASFDETLHLRRTRRMIRGDQVNDSPLEPLPKFFAILASADWRCAFEESLSIGD